MKGVFPFVGKSVFPNCEMWTQAPLHKRLSQSGHLRACASLVGSTQDTISDRHPSGYLP